MLDIKELLKIGDVKIIQRKISIYNILNGTNYSMLNLGIFNYDNILNYYGIPFDEIDFSKLKEYKKNYKIIERWLIWVLNNCEEKDDKEKYPNSKFYFYKSRFILEYDLKSKIFWVSNSKMYSKIDSKFKFGYSFILINNILQEYFKFDDCLTSYKIIKDEVLLENHFIVNDFNTNQ